VQSNSASKKNDLSQGYAAPVNGTGSGQQQTGSILFVEAITDREQEVLSLIATGLSNQEIADELIISVNTAKRHAHNIYGKLGVKRRMQAIAQARTLALL
jgi:ATP/maltotriose-dependent transcriptional regulator MalT